MSRSLSQKALIETTREVESDEQVDAAELDRAHVVDEIIGAAMEHTLRFGQVRHRPALRCSFFIMLLLRWLVCRPLLLCSSSKHHSSYGWAGSYFNCIRWDFRFSGV